MKKTILAHDPEWIDAEARLGLLEEAAGRAIRERRPNISIVRRVSPPLLLPARIGSILYGPDGRSIEEGTR